MADLAVAAPMNTKRKDVEVVANHGFSIFLDPKRIKLQLPDDKVVDMMEEDEPLEHAPIATATATVPTIVHDKVSIVSVGISSEPPANKFSEYQGAAAEAPMDIEAEGQQHHPYQNASFFSGFF